MEGTIRFTDMAEVVKAALDESGSSSVGSVTEVLAADQAAREAAARAAAGIAGVNVGTRL